MNAAARRGRPGQKQLCKTTRDARMRGRERADGQQRENPGIGGILGTIKSGGPTRELTNCPGLYYTHTHIGGQRYKINTLLSPLQKCEAAHTCSYIVVVLRR